MAIGTPTSLGTTSAAAGSTTLVLTTTASAPAGSVIVVFASDSGNVNPQSVADSAANSYSAGTTVNNGTGRSRYFIAGPIAAALASGGTITVTFVTVGGVKLLSAFAITGLAARDVAGAGASGTSTTPSIASGGLSWPAQIVLAYTHVVGGAADGFTTLASVLSTDALRPAYQIVSAGAAVTYAPTLGTSRTWGANVLSFVAQDGAGRAFAARQSFLTL